MHSQILFNVLCGYYTPHRFNGNKSDTANCTHGSYCHGYKQDKFIIHSIAITVSLYELTMELNDRLLKVYCALHFRLCLDANADSLQNRRCN